MSLVLIHATSWFQLMRSNPESKLDSESLYIAVFYGTPQLTIQDPAVQDSEIHDPAIQTE